MEDFSMLLTNAANKHLIEPVQPATKGSKITHLFFADDCILFTKASACSVLNLKDIIYRFTNTSGQLLNLDKSSIFFSKYLNEDACEDISEILQMKQMKKDEKYLGVDLFTTRNRDNCFQGSMEKMNFYLQKWQGKIINQGEELLR